MLDLVVGAGSVVFVRRGRSASVVATERNPTLVDSDQEESVNPLRLKMYDH